MLGVRKALRVVRHVARRHEALDRRVLANGDYCKVFSSSPRLLRLWESKGAVMLAMGLRFTWRWIEMKWNLAGGPSSGMGVVIDGPR